jgi:lysozyme
MPLGALKAVKAAKAVKKVDKAKQVKPWNKKWSSTKVEREARATEQGFPEAEDADRMWFHGTHDEIDEFSFDKGGDLGFHFGSYEQSNAILADKGRVRAKMRGEEVPTLSQAEEMGFADTGGNIIPARLRLNKGLLTRDVGGWDSAPIVHQELMRVARAEGLNDLVHDLRVVPEGTQEDALNFMRGALLKHGFDHITYVNNVEGPKSGQRAYAKIVLDPKNIKSNFAKFGAAAAAAGSANISADTLEIERDQIEEDEGRVLNPEGRHVSYLDTEKLLTGGIGHLLSAEEREKYPEGTPIPDKVVNQWFEEDLKQAQKDADKFFRSDDPEIRSILTNMAFNLGRTRLNKFKRLRAALEQGDLDAAAFEMKNSKWAGQVKGRATRLIERMNRLNEGEG